jgi:hypothetical protein
MVLLSEILKDCKMVLMWENLRAGLCSNLMEKNLEAVKMNWWECKMAPKKEI